MGFKTVQFVRRVDENLFCSICREVFKDPVSCKDGHTFCKDCIHEWLKTNKKCPLDNGALAENQLVRALIPRGIIDNLEVYCHPCTQDEPSEDGCDWVDKLQNLPQHRKTCPFQLVQCSHVGCTETMERRQLENHEKLCDFRKVECPKCGMVLLQHEIEKHIRDDCLQTLIACPNRCQVSQQGCFVIKKILRINLDDHLSKVCPKTLVDCPYKEQGCEMKVERQDVEEHVQENMAGHMLLLAKECSSLRKENKSLKEQFSFLSLRCSSLAQANLEWKKNLVSYTWDLHDFPDQSKNHPNGSFIKSPTFFLRGHKWHLSLYPNGNTADAAEYISLFLYKDEDELSEESAKTPYRVTVCSQNPGTDDVSFQGENAFTKKATNWGRFKLMKVSDAVSPTYCTNGILTIQCTTQLDKPQ